MESVAAVHGKAQRLRRDLTDAEKLQWARLRKRDLQGVKFRRQFPIGDFIVDFCARSKRLVIELDGGQHAEPSEAKRDASRTKQLEERGYRVIRFWNNEVLGNIEGVLEVILSELGATND